MDEKVLDEKIESLKPFVNVGQKIICLLRDLNDEGFKQFLPYLWEDILVRKYREPLGSSTVAIGKEKASEIIKKELGIDYDFDPRRERQRKNYEDMLKKEPSIFIGHEDTSIGDIVYHIQTSEKRISIGRLSYDNLEEKIREFKPL